MRTIREKTSKNKERKLSYSSTNGELQNSNTLSCLSERINISHNSNNAWDISYQFSVIWIF